MNLVDVVVPDGIDDPARPSGGNAYDRRVCRGLTAMGWLGARARRGRFVAVAGHRVVAGAGPRDRGDPGRRHRAARRADRVHRPGRAGACGPPAVAGRPGAHAAGRRAARARRRRRERGRGRCSRCRAGRRHDERVDARAAARPVRHCVPTGCTWPSPAPTPPLLRPVLPTAANCSASPRSRRTRGTTCCSARWRRSPTCRGAASAWARSTVTRGSSRGCAGRPTPTASAIGSAWPVRTRLRNSTARTPPRTRSCWPHVARRYGMVVTEALARGLPVIATAVGGLPEALGHASDGRPPGLLVPPDDPPALAVALRDWLSDAGLAATAQGGRAGPAPDIARLVGHHGPDRERAGRAGDRMSDAGAGEPGLARPARAGRRRGPRHRPGRRDPAPIAGGRAHRRARPRLRHRLDGPLARAPAGRLAALGHVRPGRRPARPGRGCRSRRRDGSAVTVETRQRDITRLDHERPGRRVADHRVGAARHADRGRAGPDRRRLRRRRLPGAADASR